MITIFGWMEIRSTYLDEDLHPEIDENMIYYKVEKLIHELKYNEIELLKKNYTRFIQFNVIENHRSVKTEEILNVFEKISKIATGSYGLLYFLDDEDDIYNDEFRVLISKKGILDWRSDEFFSPCSKMLEEFD